MIDSNAYKYLRIKCKDTLVVSAPSVSTPIYFMPIGTHQSFGLLLFKKPKDLRFDSVISLYEFCKDIPSEIQEKDTLQNSCLWLPCFKSEITNSKSCLLKGLQIDENEYIDQSIVTNCVQIKDHEAKEASLKFKTKDKDSVIDTDFVFILTHPELEEKAKVPFM